MYKVYQQQHDKYGHVVIIEASDDGEYQLPFFALQQAYKQKRLLKESGSHKTRLLIDAQIMSPTQAEKWSRVEYQSLPKCQACAKILGGDVYTHQLCGDHLFCSKDCSDKDYAQQIERMNDEHEVEL
jgi:hypothetical protein